MQLLKTSFGVGCGDIARHLDHELNKIQKFCFFTRLSSSCYRYLELVSILV